MILTSEVSLKVKFPPPGQTTQLCCAKVNQRLGNINEELIPGWSILYMALSFMPALQFFYRNLHDFGVENLVWKQTSEVSVMIHDFCIHTPIKLTIQFSIVSALSEKPHSNKFLQVLIYMQNVQNESNVDENFVSDPSFIFF